LTYLKSITNAKVIIFHYFLLSFLFSQNYKSIHQQQLEYYNANYVMPERVDTNTVINPISDRTRNISKEVFGYHPYWMGTSWTSYNFSLISTLAYFSAEVTSTGGLSDLHGWPVASLINEAHEHGTKVVLCATLFNSSDITTLLSSAQYRQNLIDNLLFQVQAGNADGVNIDFESFPASQRNNMVTFITDLTETFHNVIPGSQVTLAMPPVDWSNAWDYNALASISDGLFIMGYNYHWSGSPNTGPNSPLSGPNYTLEWTISDYLNKTNFQFEKLILGIPYYGYEWPSSSEFAGAATSGLGSAKFYTEMEGLALSYDKQWHPESQTPWYRYNNNGWNQGWYDDSLSLSLKYDFTLSIGLKGVGIWALGYDNGRQELWDLLRLKFEGQDLKVKNHYNSSSPSTLINTIFPNPSNSSIIFSFNIPDIKKINHIIIYDILGNQIFSEKKKFNDKSILWRWEGKNKFGSKLPSGVYYVTLKNDKFIDMKKITLLK
jgi:spore germination protein YaaH